MKTQILRAVASPPMMFWVPYKIAVLNIGIMVTFWLLGILIFNISPIFFLSLMFISHGLLVSIAAREPHLDTLLDAWSFKQKRYAHLIRSKGTKFLP